MKQKEKMLIQQLEKNEKEHKEEKQKLYDYIDKLIDKTGNTYNIPVDERGNTGNCVAKRKKTPERLPKCKVSDTAGDTAIYGVFSGHYARGESSVEALGAGAILISAGVSLSIGDLLESAGDGTARPQTGSDATVFKSSTIGKVTSTTKIVTHSDGSFTVPCTLHCG